MSNKNKYVMNTITSKLAIGNQFIPNKLPITSKIIWIKYCRNIVWRGNVIFSQAKEIIFDRCDNNFTYY